MCPQSYVRWMEMVLSLHFPLLAFPYPLIITNIFQINKINKCVNSCSYGRMYNDLRCYDFNFFNNSYLDKETK